MFSVGTKLQNKNAFRFCDKTKGGTLGSNVLAIQLLSSNRTAFITNLNDTRLASQNANFVSLRASSECPLKRQDVNKRDDQQYAAGDEDLPLDIGLEYKSDTHKEHTHSE